FEALGIDVAFNTVAVILAVTFVASPFYVRTAVSALEAVDPALPAAARTLGAGQARVFFRIALPLAAGGLGAGAALAFARGVGEFGATIMFAGSLRGVTQTLSLAIYELFDVDFDVAIVGPSGAGKTTLLRALAGLARPDRGRIALGDVVWFDDRTNLPPEERDVGFVFQDYALFPHLSVRANVAFGGGNGRV